MAQIRPFAAIRYSSELTPRHSDLIAPPYDVLDEEGKAALQKRHPNNIVAIDLPYLPPKTLGPDAVYESANLTLRQWLTRGILSKDTAPGYYAYSQTYTHNGRTYNRRGFFSLVRLSPFGQGQVFPHEKTYPSAIADRLQLTRATRTQLSPVFGLFSDPDNAVTGRLFQGLKAPLSTATLDKVQNDLWRVTDPAAVAAVTSMMAEKSIYIADGHHRYTMALQYEKEQPNLPPDHPAHYALFVLVAMQDPGLLILPTHRILGGLTGFDPISLQSRLGSNARLTELSIPPQNIAHYSDAVLPTRPANTFGLFDGHTRKLHELQITNPDILKSLEPGQSPAWRSLDVAILQRYLLDEIIGPAFAPGREIAKSYTADANAIVPMTDGSNRQIALILKSTPLAALEQLGHHNEVMPQKSTYFFPKLATGMLLNSLEA